MNTDLKRGKVNGRRKQISDCGFKTKKEAYIAGQKAYDEFINGSVTECNMLYSDYLDLHNYIKEKIVNDKKYYLFFDEIQNVESCETAVNLFKAKYKNNVSIFITGSNSDLLSGELATHLASRYISFKVYPFTFKEVCELKNIKDKNKYELENDFNEYIKWGGLPQRVIISMKYYYVIRLTNEFKLFKLIIFSNKIRKGD